MAKAEIGRKYREVAKSADKTRTYETRPGLAKYFAHRAQSERPIKIAMTTMATVEDDGSIIAMM